MVSPEHVEKQTPEAQQAPFPAVKQEVAAGVETKRARKMRRVGIILSLAGSIFVILSLLLPLPEELVPQLQLLFLFLLGAVSAGLFGSWRAMLYIPLASEVGGLLALIPLLTIRPYAFSIDNPFENGAGIAFLFVTIINLLIVPVGALIGISIGKVVKYPIK